MSNIPAGYKQTELGVIPEDWGLFPIEELTPKNKKYTIVDGPFGSNLKTIHYRKSGIPIITSGYVTGGKFIASEYLYVDLEKFKQEKRSAVKGGDIVMAKIGERCGASAILPKEHPEGILSGNALKITIDENRFSTELIAQILWRHHTKRNLEILRTTGAQPAISIANLKKYKIPLPPTKAEQTAIAAALSDADALITSLETLIAKKRKIKEGAMQDLFRLNHDSRDSRDEYDGKKKSGKSVNHKNHSSDKWVVKKLGEIGTFSKGQGIRKDECLSGSIPCIRYGELYTRHNDYIKQYYSFISESVAKTAKKLKPGDILFAGSGETKEEIGKCAAFMDNIEAYAGGDVVILSPANVDSLFLGFYLNTPSFVKQKASKGQGDAVVHISAGNLKDIEIPIPPLSEQARIAAILSDMDAEIEGLEKKLTKYRRIKQGMMQELLTGKKRLI